MYSEGLAIAMPYTVTLWSRVETEWAMVGSMKWYPVSKSYQQKVYPTRTTGYVTSFPGTSTLEYSQSNVTTLTVWKEVK
jgi:hypothetical protein